MAFRKKATFILEYNPDILIVPECEHPDKLTIDFGKQKPTNILWFGSNQNKGLAVFSFNKYTLRVLESHNPELKLIIPIAVSSELFDFTLYAIWANHPTDPDGKYIEQVWKAINQYDEFLSNKQTMLIGDFNSNTIWDKKSRIGNHTDVVNRLREKEIFSSYHLFHKQIQGKEMHPTIYMYRHKNKPYHIDYCFVSKDLADRITNVEVGDYDYWSKFSDHMPVIVSIN